MTKIAFPTDDGETISAHFGRAAFFVIATLDGGQVTGYETRAKNTEAPLIQLDGESRQPPADHHTAMFAPLRDCQVLVARGMGQPVFDQAQKQGLEVILTGVKDIRQAAAEYPAGTLSSDLRRIHNRQPQGN
jgi:predicted Fe-Mo cluster-binding NifX family protein